MLKTERVELEGGEWWEIATVHTVGVFRAMAPVQEQIVNMEEVKAAIDAGKPTPPMRDKDGRDISDLISTEMVFGATVNWSYGPVTREVFNQVPLDHYQVVARRVDELCSSLPLPGKPGESGPKT